MKVVPVKELVANIENLMKTQVGVNDIILSYIDSSVDFDLLIDQQQMEQVLINLVKNAIEAFNGQNEKKVKLRVYQQFQYKVIEVEDNGPGIIKEALDKIFVPFYTTKSSGSGIGLSLSRQLVRMNGGNLTVESTPNESTIFKIVF
jgi:C4-dicarboxylate-specific signal transduction histidine kinase